MAKKSKTTKKEATVYIGKSLPSLPQYMTFRGGVLPPHVAEIAAKNDAVAGLIVPASQLQEARANMRKKGHILNFYFAKQQQTKGE